MAATGYSLSTSVRAGTSNVSFALGTDTPATYSTRFARSAGTELFNGSTVSLTTRTVPSNGWLGYGWPSTLTWAPAASVPTGLYQLQVKRSTELSWTPVCEFAVLPKTPGTVRRLMLIDFMTPQAYNTSGGASLYSGPTGRAASVSFDRPLGLLTFQPDLLAWMSANGFSTEVASLNDLQTSPALLDPYDSIVFGNHVEYWTKEMRDVVEAFVRRGGNVVSLSGNTSYRQARLEGTGNRTLVCFKASSPDPNTDLQRQTVAFAETPVNRPPNAMLGAGWTHGAWNGGGTAFSFYFLDHWALAGVSTGASSAFMSYETDAAPFSLESEGYPRVTGEESTPLSTTILGAADCSSWTKPGAATISLFVKNGTVFHAGTTDWLQNLTSDPAVQQITRNVMTKLGTPRTFDWEYLGAANDVRGMAAADNKLFAATGDNVLWRRYPVLANAPFRNIGHANGVVAMAGTKGLLFVVTADNNLWARPPTEANIDWSWIGTGAPNGTRALAALGSTLYAVATDGSLVHRPANLANSGWYGAPANSMGNDTTIRAMTSYNGILFAATTGNRLVRSSFDFVEESTSWLDVWHCDNATALAVVDNMLFVTTSLNQLWWLDLHASAWDSRG
jgi:hypothetical protein